MIDKIRDNINNISVCFFAFCALASFVYPALALASLHGLIDFADSVSTFLAIGLGFGFLSLCHAASSLYFWFYIIPQLELDDDE